MIILGDKYNFTNTDIKRLNKVFNKIKHISYNNKKASKIIKNIDSTLKNDKKRLIVLNTKAKLHPKLLDYLIKLESKGIEYMSIEAFLEKYLHKYITFEEQYSVKIKGYTFLQYIQKRIIDYIGVAILFIPTILALIYSKYRISKESPGRLIYSQVRLGKNEQEFKCIKIRSMCENAEKNGATFATCDDPRVYPWGKIIRESKIDELPQIWNILKGEMHLVGPRPERPIWVKEFQKSIKHYNKRHIVSPGLTGLAQIKYQYGAGKLDAEQKLMYDLYYIKNWSLKLELEIIYKTAIFVFTKKREDRSNF